MKKETARPRTLILPPAPYAAAILGGWWLDRHVFRLGLDMGPAARPLAGLAVAAGLFLMAWAAFRFWRHHTTINPYGSASSLCTDGPFRFSRNPIYLGDWFLLAGLSLWFSTLWPILLSPAVWVTIRYGVIRYEEAHLEARFGDEYLNYKAKVRRWI